MPTKAQKRDSRRWREARLADGWAVFRGKMTSPEELAEIFRPHLVKECGAYCIWEYDVDAPLTVFGHTFKGLRDVMRHIHYSARSICGFYAEPIEPEQTVSGIYCAQVYEPYPIFDEYDLWDNRVYLNVFFSQHPFTPEKLVELSSLNNGFNFCMVHDRLPVNALPVLYHDGDSRTMLFASV